MVMETLKNVQSIGGFNVVVMDELRDQYPEKFNESGSMDYKWFEKDIRPHNFIYVRHDVNSLSFTIQNGTVGENGINGCQVVTVLETAQKIIEGLNAKFPSSYNDNTLSALASAIHWQHQRTKDREARGVEGLSKL